MIKVNLIVTFEYIKMKQKHDLNKRNIKYKLQHNYVTMMKTKKETQIMKVDCKYEEIKTISQDFCCC